MSFSKIPFKSLFRIPRTSCVREQMQYAINTRGMNRIIASHPWCNRFCNKACMKKQIDKCIETPEKFCEQNCKEDCFFTKD